MLLGTHVVAAVDPDKQNATCGEVVEMLMYAADNYNPDLKRTDIIHGYGETIIYRRTGRSRALRH